MPEYHQSQEMAAIAQEISDYLADHPDAADSLEGILKWWLTRQHYERAARKVQKALEHLVACGVVVAHKTANGKILYSSARRPLTSKH